MVEDENEVRITRRELLGAIKQSALGAALVPPSMYLLLRFMNSKYPEQTERRVLVEEKKDEMSDYSILSVELYSGFVEKISGPLLNFPDFVNFGLPGLHQGEVTPEVAARYDAQYQSELVNKSDRVLEFSSEIEEESQIELKCLELLGQTPKPDLKELMDGVVDLCGLVISLQDAKNAEIMHSLGYRYMPKLLNQGHKVYGLEDPDVLREYFEAVAELLATDVPKRLGNLHKDIEKYLQTAGPKEVYVMEKLHSILGKLETYCRKRNLFRDNYSKGEVRRIAGELSLVNMVKRVDSWFNYADHLTPMIILTEQDHYIHAVERAKSTGKSVRLFE